MKKFAVFFIAIVMGLSILTSCEEVPEKTDGTNIENSSAEEPDSIMGEWKTDSILEINCVEYDKEKDQIVDAVIIQERYLICSWYNNDATKSGLKYYDLYKNELLREYYFEKRGISYTLTVYEDDSFAAFGYGAEYIYFDSFDDDNPEIIYLSDAESTDESGAAEYSEYNFYAPQKYIRTAGAKIYLGGYKTDETFLCDLSDYYEGYLSFKYESEGNLYFSSENKFTKKTDFFVVNPDGSFEYIKEDYSGVMCFTENKAFTSDSVNGMVSIVLKNNLYYNLNIYYDTKNENIEFANDNNFATFEYNYSEDDTSSTFRIYSLDNASLIYRTTEFSERGWLISGEFINDTKAFVAFNNVVDGENPCYEYSFFIIDISDSKPIERERQMGTDLSVPFELEYSLESEYGIEIFTGEDAIINFPDFYAAELNDISTITDTLEALQWVMARFPTGFFQELYSEENQYGPSKLCIYITSTLSPADETGVSFPAAYAYYDYERNSQVIVADGTQSYSLRTNFAHEIMHAIETRINNKTDYVSFFGFDKWNEYLPDGFEYNYGYRDENGYDYSDLEYTAYYSEDASNVYFIDSYSKTFPLEDRARLFENLFMSENELNTVFTYENIKARAEYLCAVIRETFESVKQSDSVWWERFIYTKSNAVASSCY